MKHALLAVAALLAVSAGAHAVEWEEIKEDRKAFSERPEATPDPDWRENGKCGPWQGIELGPANLEPILDDHALWLKAVDITSLSETEEADPRRANLCEADLVGVNLKIADLRRADLIRANLSRANLSGAGLIVANLVGANLVNADLNGAFLVNATLAEASLIRADLSGADLRFADLREADLRTANLSDANLSGADLSGANLFNADLSGAAFEPKERERPNLWAMRKARNLHKLRYVEDPDTLFAIRKKFKENGRRDLERQLTHAIKRSERINAGGVEGALTLVLFEMTSEYGMSPGRPLKILLVLILVFSFFYVAPIVGDTKAGVFRVRDDKRPGGAGDDEPERLVEYGLAGLGFVLFFSLLSAFHIGWRDLNVGNWIARIFPRDYRLRGKGWVKAVSGLQSLISVYLLALSALTYFGRPFG